MGMYDIARRSKRASRINSELTRGETRGNSAVRRQPVSRSAVRTTAAAGKVNEFQWESHRTRRSA